MAPRPVPQWAAPPLIPEYFAGRELFITGATGFMGKVLVERLLWTCGDISRIHLLVRHKRDVTPEKRLAQLKQSQVFDVVREHCPHQLEKLHIIPGDITLPDLGIETTAFQQIDKVSVVFHVAATLKFDEPLRAAVQQNVRSVLAVLQLCDALPHMQVFVHVSTAYSNAELCTVEERVYPAPAPLANLLALLDALPDTLLADITPGLISPKPNTYTFTKAMAESIVAEHARTANYATAIFRPSIVISALKHPFPGWIENLNGPSGVIVGAGKGMLHVLRCAGNGRADMIPVDIAIDTLIAVAWDTAMHDSREARVYNCSSYSQPTSWREFRSVMLRAVREHPFDAALWYPWGVITENRYIHQLLETMFQVIPLNLIQMCCKLGGVKNRLSLSVVSTRLHAMNEALKFFSTREWHFSTHQVEKLRQRLSVPDANIYNLDPSTIEWESHIYEFVKGTRQYLLREKPEDIEKARRNMTILHFIHRITKLFIIYFIGRIAVRSAPAILRTISTLLQLRKRIKY